MGKVKKKMCVRVFAIKNVEMYSVSMQLSNSVFFALCWQKGAHIGLNWWWWWCLTCIHYGAAHVEHIFNSTTCMALLVTVTKIKVAMSNEHQPLKQ